MSSLINLNVGGTSFSTTLSTLCSDSNSMLAAMFDPERSSGRAPAMKDLNGAYFIDRDPKAFAVILGFLRTGEVFLHHTGVSEKQIQIEADYFGLEGMIKTLRRQQGDIVSVPHDDERQVIIYYDAIG
jgi:hypothetical protein